MQNIVELMREKSIHNLFKATGFNTNWDIWKSALNRYAPNMTPRQVLDLGDHLSEVFNSTNPANQLAPTAPAARTQSSVSSGGSSWEALVCWYLNFCLIGRRTVVIKHSKRLIPAPISDAMTVNYSNFISNTESDLVAITFPNHQDYCIDKDRIAITDANGNLVPTKKSRSYNYSDVVNALAHRDLRNIEIHIIQCKTNWNDNAQIPMLWDMIYSANNFRNGIKVGGNLYSIHDAARFSYSFVTVPTIKTKITASSTCVKRVINISGGNYWGAPTTSSVASSVKEMLSRNLSTGHLDSHLTTLGNELPKLASTYSYFNL